MLSRKVTIHASCADSLATSIIINTVGSFASEKAAGAIAKTPLNRYTMAARAGSHTVSDAHFNLERF